MHVCLCLCVEESEGYGGRLRVDEKAEEGIEIGW